MKLKLFLLSIVALLSLVAYQKYSRFVSNQQYLLPTYTPTVEIQANSGGPAKITTFIQSPDSLLTKYASSKAKISLSFATPVYVADVFDSVDSLTGSGYITLSKKPLTGETSEPYLQVLYGIPGLEKGGACGDENGNSLWTVKTILNQKVEVCDYKHFFSTGYPIHPKEKIEYWFAIQNNDITESDYQFFKDVVYSAKFTD